MCGAPPNPYVYFLWANGVTLPATVLYNNTSVCSRIDVDFIVDIPVPNTNQIQFGFVGDAVRITNFKAEILDATKILIPNQSI